jgi:tetratricopeptide (TPR) repeat protein
MAWCEQVLVLEREAGNTAGIARTLTHLGIIAMAQGDNPRARAFQEEGLALNRALGNKRGIVSSLNNLGSMLENQDDHERALPLLEEGLALGRELGDLQAMANTLVSLGYGHCALGRYGHAQEQWNEALRLYSEQGDRLGITISLEGMAELAATARAAREDGMIAYDPGRAVRLIGAATALRQVLGASRGPMELAAFNGQIAGLEATLGESAFTAAWEAGQAMHMEEAIAEALAIPSSGPR